MFCGSWILGTPHRWPLCSPYRRVSGLPGVWIRCPDHFPSSLDKEWRIIWTMLASYKLRQKLRREAISALGAGELCGGGWGAAREEAGIALRHPHPIPVSLAGRSQFSGHVSNLPGDSSDLPLLPPGATHSPCCSNFLRHHYLLSVHHTLGSRTTC